MRSFTELESWHLKYWPFTKTYTPFNGVKKIHATILVKSQPVYISWVSFGIVMRHSDWTRYTSKRIWQTSLLTMTLHCVSKKIYISNQRKRERKKERYFLSSRHSPFSAKACLLTMINKNVQKLNIKNYSRKERNHLRRISRKNGDSGIGLKTEILQDEHWQAFSLKRKKDRKRVRENENEYS